MSSVLNQEGGNEPPDVSGNLLFMLKVLKKFYCNQSTESTKIHYSFSNFVVIWH